MISSLQFFNAVMDDDSLDFGESTVPAASNADHQYHPQGDAETRIGTVNNLQSSDSGIDKGVLS